MRRITVWCVVAVMVAVCVWSSQSPARGQSVPFSTATSVATPDVEDIISRSIKAEAALKSVHTNRQDADGHSGADLLAAGDCINQPNAVLAKFRLTGNESDSDGSIHHINAEFVARMGETGNIRARVRPAGKRGSWRDAATLSYPDDLSPYMSDVCPFLQVLGSNIDFSHFGDYVSYGSRGKIGRRAVWVVSIDLAPGAKDSSEVETLSIDQRTLYWVHAEFIQSSPITNQQWSADYSRFNKPITIRLPKIGSTTP
jgi:hypothetical protein